MDPLTIAALASAGTSLLGSKGGGAPVSVTQSNSQVQTLAFNPNIQVSSPGSSAQFPAQTFSATVPTSQGTDQSGRTGNDPGWSLPSATSLIGEGTSTAGVSSLSTGTIIALLGIAAVIYFMYAK